MNKKNNTPRHHSLWDFSQWEFEAPEFTLPCGAGIGRTQCLSFPSGFTLYRSELRVTNTCTIEAQNTDPQLHELLCTQCHLSGHSIMTTMDGKQYTTSDDMGLLFRTLPPGLRYTLPGQQLIRHVGVSAPASATLERLPQPLPANIEAFLQPPSHVTHVSTFKINNRLRKMLSQVFTAREQSLTQTLTLEGMAIGIYAEIIQQYSQQDQLNKKLSHPNEQQEFTELVHYLRRHLALPLRAEDVMQRFGMTKYRLHKLFQNQQDCSFADFLRRERLHRARALIEEGMAVKAAAFTVGYKHTSNFTLAYRDFFGETPGQTQQSSTDH